MKITLIQPRVGHNPAYIHEPLNLGYLAAYLRQNGYGDIAIRWKQSSEELLRKVAPKLEQIKEEIEKIEKRGGHSFVFRKLYGEADFNYQLAKKGNGVHNPDYTQELLTFANRRLDEATQQLAKRKQEVAQGKMVSPSLRKR